ncbi:hypothetical protein HRbin01_00603 [archaeon HR01]|nr:hypothetical protein HRbin01_00603 [archaeon HR01]
MDWLAVYDDSLEYEELVEAFEREYPMYRWREQAVADERQVEDMVINHVLAQIEDLSEESLKSLHRALEERFQIEHATEPVPQPREQVQTVEEQVITQPPKAEEVVVGKPVITLAVLAKYPWLEEAKGFTKAFNLSLPAKVYHRAGGRVFEALDRGELGVIPQLGDPFTELLSFPLAKAIVSTVSDEWLRRRWSLAEATRVERLLHQEPDNVFVFLLGRLGLKAERDGDGYRIGVADYLRLAKDLTRDVSWKLVNQRLHMGWVYLSRARLTRLLRQYLYQSLLNSFENTPKLTKPPEPVAEIIAEVVQRIQEIKAGWKAVKPSGRTPPCMDAIRERLADAGHTENFVYAAYLLNKGYTVEQVVDVFRVRSDFKEEIARYQVEHIAGMRGSRTKYRPPSCSRMRDLGLCIKNGELCPRNIRNPLDY